MRGAAPKLGQALCHVVDMAATQRQQRGRAYVATWMVLALALAVPTSHATGLSDLPAPAAGTDVLQRCHTSITAKYEADVLLVNHPLHGTVAKASARLRGDARATHGARGLASATAPAKLLVLVNGHAASRVPCHAGVAASCTVQVVVVRSTGAVCCAKICPR